MAAYTTAVTSASVLNSAHFTPPGLPGLGDQVTIANGHTLTNPTGNTLVIGDPAVPATHAIRTAGTSGTGIFINNGTVDLRADVLQGNATWRVEGAGATVRGNNSTTALTWQVGDANGLANCLLVIAGTGIGANRALVEAAAGSAGFRITCPFNAGRSQVSFARLENLGTAALDAFTSTVTGTNSLTWSDYIVNNCGRLVIGSGAVPAGASLDVRRAMITNPKASEAWRSALDTASATGTRLFEDVCIRAGLLFVTLPASGIVAATFRRCAFVGGFTRTGTVKATFEDCLWRNPSVGGGGIGCNGDVTRGFITVNSPSQNNFHGLSWSVPGTFTVDGLLVDAVVLAAGGQGDILMPGNPASALNLAVRNVVGTRPPGTGAYGKLTSQIAGVNGIVTEVTNCTWFAHDNIEGSLVGVGETYAGFAGMVQSMRHNLVIGMVSGGGVIVSRQPAGAAANLRDAATKANIANNIVYQQRVDATNGAGHLTSAGGDGIMWNAPNPSYPDVNPAVVDESRNLATWYRAVAGGTAGTRTADMDLAYDAICAQWSDSPIAGATIPNAWAWIRDGYKPRNFTVRTGASSNNGGWVGAERGNSLARLRRACAI